MQVHASLPDVGARVAVELRAYAARVEKGTKDATLSDGAAAAFAKLNLWITRRGCLPAGVDDRRV